jgi:uncharacterized membrane protein YeaQ/YmgE (transglycosylase-associated protein family)
MNQVRDEVQYEKWHHWPVNWSAIFVGTLSALAAMLIIGLIGLAVGAHLLNPENRWVEVKKLSTGALIFGVGGAFFSFVIGGWIAGKVGGILRAEPSILHAAIVWLVSIPAIVLVAGLGAGTLLGEWYGGFSGSTFTATAHPFEKPDALDSTATADERAKYQAAMNEYREKIRQWKEDTPKVTRNTALGAITALLLGLVGSVIGGWLASGEPMYFSHYRNRRLPAHRQS